MHRRPLGRGRLLILLGAAVIVVGCLLPWHSIGGSDGLPLVQSRGLAGSGIATFLAAIMAMGVVALPYASGGRPVALDRALTYTLLTGLAIAGLVIWPIEFALVGALSGLLPLSAPGYWLAILGTILMARGTYQIGRERQRLW